jgi:hypothetical protein
MLSVRMRYSFDSNQRNTMLAKGRRKKPLFGLNLERKQRGFFTIGYFVSTLID